MMDKSTHNEDHELLDKIAAGDRRAEDRLLEKYFKPIGTYLRYHLRNASKAAAEDLRQDLLAEILSSARAGKIKIKYTFCSYLYRAAHFKVCRYEKTRKEFIPLETDDPGEQAMIDRELYKYLCRLQREEPVLNTHELREIIARLKPSVRKIIHDRFIEGLTCEEIAQAHKKSVFAVRKALQRAKEAFRVEAKVYLKFFVTFLLGQILIFGVERMMESA